MSPSMRAEVTPSEAGQLLRLRTMLDRATTAARVNFTLDTGTTAVLLDAVNDRAAHLVAVSRGDISIARNDSVVDLYSKLHQAMPDWKFSSFADVRQLHVARNQAQHEGLEPAREHIPGWATATRAFTTSVVEAYFGVNLDRVHLSDALDDDEAVNLLRDAEVALDEHRPTRAVQLAGEAFGRAAQAWRAASQRSPAPNLGFNDLLSREAAKSIRAADATGVHGAFATDPAELVWFTKARNESELCDEDDARRALAFVFWWVVGWQRFKAANIDRRTRAMERRRRRRRSPQDHAHVAEVVDFARGFGAEDWEVTLLVADVPADRTDFDLWSLHVSELMHEACQSLRIDADGTVQFRTTVDHFDTVIEQLGRAVVEADDLAERTSARLARESEERQATLSQFTAACEARRAEFPKWVEHVTTTTSIGPGNKDVPALELTLMPQPIASGVHEAFGAVHIWGSREGSWGMMLPLDVDQVLDACQHADASIGPALQSAANKATESQQARGNAWDTLTTSLRRHGVTSMPHPPERRSPSW